MYFQLNFYNFPQVQSQTVSLVDAEQLASSWHYNADTKHFLMPKDRFSQDFNGREVSAPFRTVVEDDLINLAFDVDPSLHLSSMRQDI